MAQVETKSAKARNLRGLPPAARRLIEENRRRRINLSKTRGDWRGRLGETIAYLRWKTDCSTLSDAICYVDSELERERLYALYRELFPKQWKRSRASFNRTDRHEHHTARECEFIELVGEHYFPLCSWLDWTDYRFDHIPIEPLNYDFCCGEYEWQEFRPCLQFGVPAFLWRSPGDDDWSDILAHFCVARDALPPISRETPPYSALDKRKDEPKIRRFLHLVEFIYHDTGNPFIDTTCCQPSDLYEWSQANLEKLKNDYQGVSDYYASMESLDDSIERDALSTFQELIALWNTGELPADGRQKNLPFESFEPGGGTAGDGDSGLLINILADFEQTAGESALTF